MPFLPVIYSLVDGRYWCWVQMQEHRFDKGVVNRGSDLSWMKIQTTLPHTPPGQEGKRAPEKTDRLQRHRVAPLLSLSCRVFPRPFGAILTCTAYFPKGIGSEVWGIYTARMYHMPLMRPSSPSLARYLKRLLPVSFCVNFFSVHVSDSQFHPVLDWQAVLRQVLRF